MMRRAVLLTMLVLVALSGSGCKWMRGSSSDNIEEPAELTEYAPSVRVEETWSRGIGDLEGRHGLRKAPAIGDGRVLVGNLEGRVLAFDASSGAEVWEAETGVRISSTAGIGEGMAVFGALDGEVVALDAASGNERWRARVSSEVLAPPAVSRGVVVVRAYDGRTFGLDAATGERRWLYDRGLPTLTLRGNGAPAIAGNTVYAGYDDGRVVALRLEDGSVVWEQVVAVGEGRSDIARMVDVEGLLGIGAGEVYAVSYQGQVAALATESGVPLWSREFSSHGGLQLAGDRVLVSDAAGALFALDRRSGAALWKMDALANRWLTTPVVQGDYAVVGDLEGWLHWIALESGELAGRTRIGRDPIRATPVVSADGTLYAMTVDGDLSALRVAPR